MGCRLYSRKISLLPIKIDSGGEKQNQNFTHHFLPTLLFSQACFHPIPKFSASPQKAAQGLRGFLSWAVIALLCTSSLSQFESVWLICAGAEFSLVCSSVLMHPWDVFFFAPQDFMQPLLRETFHLLLFLVIYFYYYNIIEYIHIYIFINITTYRMLFFNFVLSWLPLPLQDNVHSRCFVFNLNSLQLVITVGILIHYKEC